MIDSRVYTFLKLCDLMNYRKTAETLNMTQPAVTQHIHVLEHEYGCKLFDYSGRVLRKTEECKRLESHLRGEVYNELKFRRELCEPHAIKISIGATKTIGDYTFQNKVMGLLERDDIELELLIDNTENLLEKLNSRELDLLLVEGFIDKELYDTRLIREEELLGICSKDHIFAGREVTVEELFGQHLLLRENGSGTRAVFEQFLHELGYSSKCFRKRSSMSSFRLIEKAVGEGRGISFVYKSIPEENPDLSTFRIKNKKITHEFNYISLKGADVAELIQLCDLEEPEQTRA